MSNKHYILFIFIVHVGISIYNKGLTLSSTFSSESVMSIAIFIAYLGVNNCTTKN